MGHHITLQACAALRGGFIALAMLALAGRASAREYLPRGFYGKEPCAWQRAGIEAALNDPSVWVQGHMLRECAERKWVSQLRIPTTQWLLWLGSPRSEVRDVAAEAAGQLGAQMPPEVQRALVRLQTLPGGDFLVARSSLQALSQTGTGVIPEVQLAELVCLQRPQGSYEMESLVWQTLGQSGAAMVPEVLQQLLSLMQSTQTAMAVRCSAAEVLARLGPQLPAQAREIMLRMLLDPQADTSLRCRAAQAMGGLGAQMPPQALQLLHAVLRDRAADGSLRYYAAAALAKMGAKMPPEVQAALLAAYAEQPTEATIKDHEVFHEKVAESLGALGTAMPLNVQQELVARFLKTARTPQPDYSALYSLQEAGPQADAAALQALLAALQDTGVDEQARSAMGTFFQRLAAHGHLPVEVQASVTALVQDEAAGLHARCQGALILGQLGEKATAEERHALGTLLKSGGPMLRIHALQAMELLGPHMPPEAIPVLLTILKKRASPAAEGMTIHEAGEISALVPSGGFLPPLDPLEHVLPALGRLGPEMPPQAPAALLAMLSNRKAHRIATALALAQMGDELPPEIQQGLVAQLLETETAPEPDGALCTAISDALSACGLHPVSDALLADALSLTHAERMDPDMQRSRLYLWLGRSPAHLLAVRWLGHQGEDPPLGDTPPQEILRLISRLWPHSAQHPELRHEMARRTRQLLTTHVKSRPLDAATQKVLRTLVTQLTQDTAPACTTALQQVQTALAADAKAR
jgi:HEAT repeat protein